MAAGVAAVGYGARRGSDGEPSAAGKSDVRRLGCGCISTPASAHEQACLAESCRDKESFCSSGLVKLLARAMARPSMPALACPRSAKASSMALSAHLRSIWLRSSEGGVLPPPPQGTPLWDARCALLLLFHRTNVYAPSNRRLSKLRRTATTISTTSVDMRSTDGERVRTARGPNARRAPRVSRGLCISRGISLTLGQRISERKRMSVTHA